MEMHNDGKPVVKQKKCIGCGRCVNICAHGAPTITDGKATIDVNKCVGCGRCLGMCPMDAIHALNDASMENLNKKILAELLWQFARSSLLPYQLNCRRISLLRLPC